METQGIAQSGTPKEPHYYFYGDTNSALRLIQKMKLDKQQYGFPKGIHDLRGRKDYILILTPYYYEANDWKKIANFLNIYAQRYNITILKQVDFL